LYGAAAKKAQLLMTNSNTKPGSTQYQKPIVLNMGNLIAAVIFLAEVVE
jgi:hypothetical protein